MLKTYAQYLNDRGSLSRTDSMATINLLLGLLLSSAEPQEVGKTVPTVACKRKPGRPKKTETKSKPGRPRKNKV